MDALQVMPLTKRKHVLPFYFLPALQLECRHGSESSWAKLVRACVEVTWEQDGSPVLSIPLFQVWTTNPQCYMREKEPLCCFKPLNLVVTCYYTTVCPKNTVNNCFQSRNDTLPSYNFLQYKATSDHHCLLLIGYNWMIIGIMLHYLLRGKITQPPHVLLGNQYIFFNVF